MSEHDLGEHLDEAAVGVVARSARCRSARSRPFDVSSFRPRLSTVSIMPGIENFAPRAHARRAAGCVGSPKRLAGLLLDAMQRGHDLLPQAWRGTASPLRVIRVAGLGRDREARRHGQPGVGHLGHARALAAEQVAHRGVALVEEIDPLARRVRHDLIQAIVLSCWPCVRVLPPCVVLRSGSAARRCALRITFSSLMCRDGSTLGSARHTMCGNCQRSPQTIIAASLRRIAFIIHSILRSDESRDGVVTASRPLSPLPVRREGEKRPCAVPLAPSQSADTRELPYLLALGILRALCG